MRVWSNLFILALIAAGEVRADACDTTVFNVTCYAPFAVYAKAIKTFSIDSANIAPACSANAAAASCVAQQAHCQNGDNLDVTVWAGTSNVYSVICSGNGKSDYLLYQPCFSSLSFINTLQKCTSASSSVLSNIDSSLSDLCTAYNAMLQCQVAGTAALCNSTAAAFFTTLLLAGEGPIIHFYTPNCVLYGNGSTIAPTAFPTTLSGVRTIAVTTQSGLVCNMTRFTICYASFAKEYALATKTFIIDSSSIATACSVTASTASCVTQQAHCPDGYNLQIAEWAGERDFYTAICNGTNRTEYLLYQPCYASVALQLVLPNCTDSLILAVTEAGISQSTLCSVYNAALNCVAVKTAATCNSTAAATFLTSLLAASLGQTIRFVSANCVVVYANISTAVTTTTPSPTTSRKGSNNAAVLTSGPTSVLSCIAYLIMLASSLITNPLTPNGHF